MNAACDVEAMAPVRGPHAAGQAAAAVVGDRQRLGLAGIRDYRDNRAEDLTGRGHRTGWSGENSGLVVVTANPRGRPPPARQPQRAFTGAGPHVPPDPGPAAPACPRTH